MSDSRLERKLETAWRKACRRRYLNVPESQQPTAILVVGLPGAGKSTIVEIVAAEIGWARIDTNELWMLHPGFAVLAQSRDREASLSVRSDAARLAYQLAVRAARRRADLVFECSSAKRGQLPPLLQVLNQNGYHVLVVGILESADRCLDAACGRDRRLEAAVGVSRGPGELEPQSALEDLLSDLERSHSVNELCLVSRQGELLEALDSRHRPWEGASRRWLAAAAIEPSAMAGVAGAAAPAPDPETQRRSQFQKTIRRLADLEQAGS